MKELTVGFIGFGNMAQAMAEGLIRGGAVKPDRIYACARNWDKLCRNAGRYGIHGCETVKEAAEKSDMVIVAVKPYLVEEVLTPVLDILREKTVVSVAVNVPFEKYEEFLLPGSLPVAFGQLWRTRVGKPAFRRRRAGQLVGQQRTVHFPVVRPAVRHQRLNALLHNPFVRQLTPGTGRARQQRSDKFCNFFSHPRHQNKHFAPNHCYNFDRPGIQPPTARTLNRINYFF